MSSDDALRRTAEKNLRARAGFWRTLLLFGIIMAVLVLVWAFTGGGYFWPAWAILGMGIALAFMGWGTFRPASGPTSAQIDAEVRRMQGDGQN